ncbi:MAG: DegV family protein [Coriobacteriia bacterium]|nr:DegV family protein [Coriobacteriia bacterium]
MTYADLSIITDSASDITPKQASEWGVSVIALKTIFSDGEFRCGLDLTPEGFFEKLIETGEMPSTSQPSPSEFQEAFRKELDKGNEVLVIALSSKLSGTCQSAELARLQFSPEEQARIHVFDSLNVCIGQLTLVYMAVQLRAAGKGTREILTLLEGYRSRIRLVALLDTLEYLKKGGRISPAVAAAGSLLAIKPVIAVEEGEIALVGKARGSKNGRNQIVKSIEKYGGADFAMPLWFGYSGLDDALLRKYLQDNAALYSDYPDETHITGIGATIGSHVGPGAIAVVFFSPEGSAV